MCPRCARGRGEAGCCHGRGVVEACAGGKAGLLLKHFGCKCALQGRFSLFSAMRPSNISIFKSSSNCSRQIVLVSQKLSINC